MKVIVALLLMTLLASFMANVTGMPLERAYLIIILSVTTLIYMEK